MGLLTTSSTVSGNPPIFFRAQRVALEARVVLELGEGRALIGNTRDISQSGTLIHIGYPPIQVSLQEHGLLHLMPLAPRPALPCQVARLTHDAIAVRFVDSLPDAFISRLGRKQ
ncbi:MAG: PilZ domain-containing protein [Magnetococcales bacterium]|nr:PilZ domain-containing protein [Magnetococcales bacterium]